MLRGLVAALLLANLLYAAWAQGWLPAGWLPLNHGESQREPDRLAAQLRPDSIRLLGAPEARQLASVRCLQAGPLAAGHWDTAASAVAAAGVPAEAWQRLSAGHGGEGDWLRVAEADPAMQARLQALAAADTGGGFKPCP